MWFWIACILAAVIGLAYGFTHPSRDEAAPAQIQKKQAAADCQYYAPKDEWRENIKALYSKAEAGDAEAVYQIGRSILTTSIAYLRKYPVFYEMTGAQKDYYAVTQWIGKAAEMGHPKANMEMYYFYRAGDFVPQCDVTAERYLMSAARQNIDPEIRDRAQSYLS